MHITNITNSIYLPIGITYDKPDSKVIIHYQYTDSIELLNFLYIFNKANIIN